MKTHRLAERRLTFLLEIMHCARNCNLQCMVKMKRRKEKKEIFRLKYLLFLDSSRGYNVTMKTAVFLSSHWGA